MIKELTTLGLVGTLAMGSTALFGGSEAGAPPMQAERLEPVVAQDIAAASPTLAEPRTASLDGADTDEQPFDDEEALLFAAAPGGGAAPGADLSNMIASVVVDDAMQSLITPGVRNGASGLAEFQLGMGGGDAALRVLNGRADAAISTRKATSRERRNGLGEERLGDLIVTLVAHPDNPVTNLSAASLRDVLRGETTDWSQLGGNPGPIRLVLPPAGPQADLFARIAIRGDALAQRATFRNSDEERIQAVRTDARALTVVSYEAARRLSAPTLRVDGVEPSLGAVRTGRYRLGAPIYLIYAAEQKAQRAVSAVRMPEVRKSFANFLTVEQE